MDLLKSRRSKNEPENMAKNDKAFYSNNAEPFNRNQNYSIQNTICMFSFLSTMEIKGDFYEGTGNSILQVFRSFKIFLLEVLKKLQTSFSPYLST